MPPLRRHIGTRNASQARSFAKRQRIGGTDESDESDDELLDSPGSSPQLAAAGSKRPSGALLDGPAGDAETAKMARCVLTRNPN